MSYGSLLKHRCDLMELRESFVKGIPQSNWVVVEQNVKCFLDLNFIRRGKDPMWTPEAGRASDRSGVLFTATKVKSGQRLRMTFGPSGVFQIEGAVDEAWKPTRRHHYEVGVTEIPSQLSNGQGA